MQRNPELDGLRGIAATGVVLSHWNPTYTFWLALLRSRLLTYLGSISYAIYMFHLPILVFLEPSIEHRLGEDLQWLTILITAACLIGFPHMSKIFLERPALALKTCLTSRYE